MSQSDRAEVRKVIINLTDAIATIERKYKHKEIDYGEYEKHSRRYEGEATDAIMLIIDQQVAEAELNGRIDEILRIKQDGETVISSPDDSWEGPSLEQRLVDLQATLKAQRGGLTP